LIAYAAETRDPDAREFALSRLARLTEAKENEARALLVAAMAALRGLGCPERASQAQALAERLA
jgi:hypothetical protein